MPRYATIDIGSNSCLLLIVEVDSQGELRVLEDTKESTKVSTGLQLEGAISSDAIKTLKSTLDRFQDLIQQYRVDNVACCATQAFRVAQNGREIVENIRNRYDWQVEIVSGQCEAELTFLSATTGLSEIADKKIVIDIGGASTEIVYGSADKIEFVNSFPIGAVVLSEKHSLDNQVAKSVKQMAVNSISSILPAHELPDYLKNRQTVVVGGTVSTLGTLLLGRKIFSPAAVHGVKISTAQLERIAEELASLGLNERKRRIPFDPQRAEIIIGGCLILTYLFKTLALEEITISNRGLRWGLLFDRFGLSGRGRF